MQITTVFFVSVLLLFFLVTAKKVTRESLERSEDLKHAVGRAGYVIIDGIEYYIDDVIKRDWVKANEFCDGIRMDLVALESEIEDKAVHDYLVENGIDSNEYWTTGSLVVGTWTWVNKGLEFNYTNWAETEPNSDGTEVCMHTSQTGWMDDDCIAFHHYICQ